jgi:hypothetical protein
MQMENSEITLTLTVKQLAELTKMVYLAQYVVDCCEDVYAHLSTFKTVQKK